MCQLSALEENTRTASKALKLNAEFIRVKTIPEIMSYNNLGLRLWL